MGVWQPELLAQGGLQEGVEFDVGQRRWIGGVVAVEGTRLPGLPRWHAAELWICWRGLGLGFRLRLWFVDAVLQLWALLVLQYGGQERDIAQVRLVVLGCVSTLRFGCGASLALWCPCVWRRDMYILSLALAERLLWPLLRCLAGEFVETPAICRRRGSRRGVLSVNILLLSSQLPRGAALFILTLLGHNRRGASLLRGLPQGRVSVRWRGRCLSLAIRARWQLQRWFLAAVELQRLSRLRGLGDPYL